MTVLNTTATRFRYTAADMHGRVRRGVLTAAHHQDARARLMAERLTPIAVNAERGRTSCRVRLSDVDLAFGLRVLADLLDGGLSLIRALDMMDALVPASWKPVLPAVRQSIRLGASLSAALEDSGARVPPGVLGLIRAGERGSGLGAAVRQAAVHLESTAETRGALVAALTYPAFLALACVATTALLVIVVLPRFAALLADIGRPLPVTTRIVLETAMFVSRWAPALLAIAATGLFLLLTWIRWPLGRQRWHAALLRVPVLGGVRHAWASAHLCATAGALLDGGVTLLAALDSGAKASGDAAVQARAVSAAAEIRQGSRPSDALQRNDTVTRACVLLIRTAEETGRMAQCMIRAAELERRRARTLTQRCMRLVEPSLVLLFGGGVAFIAASLLQAVYSTRPVP